MTTRFFDWYYKSYRYVHERFTKEKISSWGGVALTVLGVAGHLSQAQIGVIQLAASMLGYDISVSADLIAGLIAIGVPTSKIKLKK